jgi:hypothetical protein
MQHTQKELEIIVAQMQGELRLRDWRIKIAYGPARQSQPVTLQRITDSKAASIHVAPSASRGAVEAKIREAMIRLHTAPLEVRTGDEQTAQTLASAIGSAFGVSRARTTGTESPAKLATAGKSTMSKEEEQIGAQIMAKVKAEMTGFGAPALIEMWRKKLGLPIDAIAAAVVDRELKRRGGRFDATGPNGLTSRQEEICRELGVSPERFLETKSAFARGGK